MRPSETTSARKRQSTRLAAASSLGLVDSPAHAGHPLRRDTGTGDVREGTQERGTQRHEEDKQGRLKKNPATNAWILDTDLRTQEEKKSSPALARAEAVGRKSKQQTNRDHAVHIAIPTPPKEPKGPQATTNVRRAHSSSDSDGKNNLKDEKIAALEATVVAREEELRELRKEVQETEQRSTSKFTKLENELHQVHKACADQRQAVANIREEVRRELQLQDNPYFLPQPHEKRKEKKKVGQEAKRDKKRSSSDGETTVSDGHPSDQASDRSHFSCGSNASGSNSDSSTGTTRSRQRRENEKRRKRRQEERRQRKEDKRAETVKKEAGASHGKSAAAAATTRNARDTPQSQCPSASGQKTSKSLNLKEMMEWAKAPALIATGIKPLKSKADLARWQEDWADKAKKYPIVRAEWLILPKGGQAVETDPPAGETETDRQARLAVAEALLRTYDRSDPRLERFVKLAVKTSPQSIYAQLVGSLYEDTTKTTNKILTTLMTIKMENTGANIITFNKVVANLIKLREDKGKKWAQEDACNTYLEALVSQFDSVRDDIIREQADSGVYDLDAVMKRVEDWAVKNRSNRNLADFAITDRKKLDHELIETIKALTGDLCTTVNLTTNNTNIRQHPQHPLGNKGCWHWWAKEECKYKERCNKSDTHTPEYRGKGKKTAAPAARKPTPAERYKDHVCEACHAKGHSKAWKQCPARNGQTTTTASSTTANATTTTAATASKANLTSSDNVTAEFNKLAKKILEENAKQMKKQMKTMLAATVQQLTSRLARGPDPSDTMELPGDSDDDK